MARFADPLKLHAPLEKQGKGSRAKAMPPPEPLPDLHPAWMLRSKN
jgi:hypothetical protein